MSDWDFTAMMDQLRTTLPLTKSQVETISRVMSLSGSRACLDFLHRHGETESDLVKALKKVIRVQEKRKLEEWIDLGEELGMAPETLRIVAERGWDRF